MVLIDSFHALIYPVEKKYKKVNHLQEMVLIND